MFHIRTGLGSCFCVSPKFWLDPVHFESSRGFRRSELRWVERLVVQNAGVLLEAWLDRRNPTV